MTLAGQAAKPGWISRTLAKSERASKELDDWIKANPQVRMSRSIADFTSFRAASLGDLNVKVQGGMKMSAEQASTPTRSGTRKIGQVNKSTR